VNKLDIKIAFFDIDGTLTNSNKVITEKTLKTLNKLTENGIELVICSGRGNSYVLNLIKNIKSSNYIISSNGAEIYDITNKNNIYSNKIDFKKIKSLYNYAINNNLNIIFSSIYNRYVNYEPRIMADIIYLNDINILNEIDIYQVIIIDEEYYNMKKLEENIKNFSDIKIINYSIDYQNKIEYGDHWFDVVNKDVDKGKGITNLLNKLNIDKSNAICFGDGINDIDMFESCGIKVAMGNAIEIIKEKADYITDSNDDEGITAFFNKYYF